MITLQNYPGTGIPDAADESNIEYRNHRGFPQFVCWRANNDDGKPVKVVIGVHTIKADRINAMLINERTAIQAAANANYKPGDREVVLFAIVGFGPVP
ncbi:MAG TPA: hypothetical protein VFC46_02765 [Humisphaera sp.]|nr:hypothetical protein [Humisphaera sp.]